MIETTAQIPAKFCTVTIRPTNTLCGWSKYT